MDNERARVLVADGDAEMVNHVLEILERDGYHVMVARDTTEAITLATNHQAALLLLDVSLPGGGGHAVVDALHARQPDREPSVIFLADANDPAEIRQGFEAGAVDYIAKPFSPAQLRARVRTWLLRLEKSASAPEHGPHGTPPCAPS